MAAEEPTDVPPRRSLWMPLLWLVLAALVGIGACAGIGLGVNASEESGLLASQISAFPLGFVLSGALAGLIIHFGVQRATTLLRVVGPLGCGCLGGSVLAGLVVGFIALVLPTL